MDGFLKTLFALVAALNAATGAPVDVEDLPDRPAIVAPTIRPNPVLFATGTPSPTSKTTEINGTISTIQGNLIIVSGQRITLVPGSEIKGELKVGAQVKGEIRVRADGGLEAGKLEVGDDRTTPVITAKPSENTGRPTEKPEVKATEAKPTESVQVKPTEEPEPKPTEKPDSQPQPQPTEKPGDGGDSDNSPPGVSPNRSSYTMRKLFRRIHFLMNRQRL